MLKNAIALTALLTTFPCCAATLQQDIQAERQRALATLKKWDARVWSRSQLANDQLVQLGIANIILRSVKPPKQAAGDTARVLAYGLTRKDFDRLVSTIASIRVAIPLREMRIEVRHETRASSVRLVGCTGDHLGNVAWQISRGRFLNPADRRRQVAVISHAVARKLFAQQNALGQTIMIGDAAYVVVGVAKPVSPKAVAVQLSLGQDDTPREIYIPLSTMRSRLGDLIVKREARSIRKERYELSQITLTLGDFKQVEPTIEMVRRLLSKYHPTADYSLFSPKSRFAKETRNDRKAANELVMIDLRNSLATDIVLRSVSKLPSVEVLLLSNTRITDAGLKYLHDLKQLTIVWLANNKVTDDGVRQLQSALPKCTIRR